MLRDEESEKRKEREEKKLCLALQSKKIKCIKCCESFAFVRAITLDFCCEEGAMHKKSRPAFATKTEGTSC